MDIGVISVRYARALLDSAVAMKLDEDVYQEMQILCKSFLMSLIFDSPSIILCLQRIRSCS